MKNSKSLVISRYSINCGKLLDELSEHPYTGTGQPEQLKHQFAGFWSRRINQEHRIVYAVDEKNVIVTVVSAKGHYK